MSAGEDEIELKFLCEPADLAAVLAAAPVGETYEKTLVSTTVLRNQPYTTNTATSKVICT